MKTTKNSLMTSCLAILVLSGCSTQGAGLLPEFTFKGVGPPPGSPFLASYGRIGTSCSD